MIAVGLDLSLSSTGWAVWGGGCGRIRTDLAEHRHLKGRPIERRRHIALALSTALLSAPWGGDYGVLYVVERSFVSHAVSKQTAIDLASLHAVVLDLILADPIDSAPEAVAYVTPSTAKKHLAGKGGADKDQMIAAAQAVGYPGKQTDEADAWGLALIAHHLLGGSDHLTPHRASCLAATDWLVPLPETAVTP